MPPLNPARRRALTDAAIQLLATSGAHGLTHRAAERSAGLPPGTASNYYRSREALLVATAERVAELHLAEMEQAVTEGDLRLVELLSHSLLEAATTNRDRYVAVFELQLEATRRPALARILASILDATVQLTARHHTRAGLAVPPDRVPTLITLYAGALYSLVTMLPEQVEADMVHGLARAIVTGALADGEAP
ncbi:TetR/AcrR family transcriptional regulator [Nonomuraea longicatena]|uniref:TetR/AcrR family transcriptional regulator n=1 Tax=Nonomuraea longicatena TaxID=83682 RepID=A0ABN1QCG2_9ACTN